MKAFFSAIALLIISANTIGQGVGIGTNSPQSSSLLDISSTTKGILLPRMSTAQRNAIVSPAKGLLVYDSNEGLYQYNGTAWVLVGSNSGGGMVLPFSHSSAAAGALLSVGNTGNGGAIMGRSFAAGAIGVSGASTGNGGYGLSGSNTGALGYGASGIAIDGTALYAICVGEGVALRGNSPTGYALVANGGIRLGGNNMGASAGTVLTSIDANGNARWQQSELEQIAFRLENATTGFHEFSHGLTQKVHFWNKPYDLGNDAAITPFGATLSAAMSTFIVPVTGVYSFNFGLILGSIGNVGNRDYIGAKIMLDRGGAISTLHTVEEFFDPKQFQDFNLRGGCQKRLMAGDRIYLTLRQTNDAMANSSLRSAAGATWFAGYLVRAE